MSKIPSEWQMSTLGESCDIHDSRRIPLSFEQRQTKKGEYPYYGANNIQDYIDAYLFDFDAVLLAEDGGYYDEYESRPIAQFATGKYWVNNHAHILTGKARIDIKFLFYSLVHKNICPYINTGTRSKLNQSDLKLIEIVIPPLPEQKKIAEILSGIDRCIDSIASKVKKCENILQGIFVELDQIENQGQTRRLGEVVTIQNGYAFQSRMFTEEKDSIPLIRISDIQYGVVNLSKSKKIPANFSISDDYRIHKGDILIAMSGTIGKIGVSCSETICLLNQRVGKFSFQGSDVTNEFVSQLLLSGYLEHRLLAAAAGGAQPNISGQGIEALEIPLPDESRQSNLSRIISSVRNLIASENKVTAKHLHLKDSLSSDLLSGRKRVSI